MRMRSQLRCFLDLSRPTPPLPHEGGLEFLASESQLGIEMGTASLLLPGRLFPQWPQWP